MADLPCVHCHFVSNFAGIVLKLLTGLSGLLTGVLILGRGTGSYDESNDNNNDNNEEAFHPGGGSTPRANPSVASVCLQPQTASFIHTYRPDAKPFYLLLTGMIPNMSTYC